MTGAMSGKAAIEDTTSPPALAGTIFPNIACTEREWREVADRLQEIAEQRRASDAGASRWLWFRSLLPASRTNTTGRRRSSGREGGRRHQQGAVRDSKAEQIEKTVRLLGELSLDTTTPDEAHGILAPDGAEETTLL
jgi:hypothetical protein